MEKTIKKLEDVAQQAFEDYKAAESKTYKTQLLHVAIKALKVRHDLLKGGGFLPDDTGH